MTQTPGGHSAGSRRSNGTDTFLDRLQDIDLRRSDDAWIGGVCAGLAERLGVDPLVIRALFAILSLGMGLGVLLYLAAWLLIPDSSGGVHLERALRGGDGNSILLLIATVVVLLGTLGWFGSGWDGPGSWGGSLLWRLFSLLVVVGGAFWLWSEWRSRPDPGFYARENAQHRRPAGPGWTSDTSSVPSPAASPVRTSPVSASTVSASTVGASPVSAPIGGAGGGATAWSPPEQATPPHEPGWVTPDPAGPGQPPRTRTDRQPQPPRRPARRSAGAAGTLLGTGLALAAAGGLSWVVTANDWPGNGLLVGLAAALGALGLVILILGLAGRTSGFPGFLAVCALVVTALITPVANNFVVSGQLGDYTWVPTAVTEEPFRLGAGSGTLDLGALDPDDLAHDEIRTSVGFGELVITVPEDLTVRIEGSTGAGVLSVRGNGTDETGGLNLSEDITFGDGPVDLTVDARVGFGHLILEGSNR